jgi:UDP-2,3-diacylglucosamine pyrophosphatase LpxH
VTRLIIADAHVGQGSADGAEMARLVRRAAGAGFRELVYLGDAFQYLIGMRKFWTDAVRQVMAAWDGVRGEGVRVVLIEGNRDFFLDEPELASRVDFGGRQYDFAAGPRRFRTVHGDRVNLRDLQYRFWSAVSKSRVARTWARVLPEPVAVAIVTRMEARLAKTNRRFRYRKPERDLMRAAEGAWSEGIDVLLWGHFHTLWEHRSDGMLAMVVPAWLETRGSLAVGDDGTMTWVDLELRERSMPAPSATDGRSS